MGVRLAPNFRAASQRGAKEVACAQEAIDFSYLQSRMRNLREWSHASSPITLSHIPHMWSPMRQSMAHARLQDTRTRVQVRA